MIGSLFSGYGGLDMAAETLGFGPTAWHCEIEAAPAKVLAHRWPGVPNLGDITKVDWTQVEAVDVITGGFPCQDISNAGKRAGMAGARSGLWSYYADAVRVLRPRLVLVENVGALLGRGMGRVLGDLAALGYDARWVSVRASDAGAPHGRQRIFIVAENANVEPRQQHRVAPPRPAQGGGARADARGRGGAPTPDAERGARGERREPDPIGGRTRDAEQAGVGGVDATPDTARAGHEGAEPVDGAGRWHGPAEGDRRNERRAESAGLERRPDAPVGGATPTAAPDADIAGRETLNGRPRTRDAGRLQPVVDGRPAVEWGAYAAAIHRWEHAIGRQAPRPTEPGQRGGERLSPAFVEWMMGLPAGWVCDVPGLSRNEQLKMLGNGVVPQQAVLAFTALLRASEVAA